MRAQGGAAGRAAACAAGLTACLLIPIAGSPWPTRSPQPGAAGARVLANARIVDGTGADAFEGWVRVEGDRITAVGRGAPPDAAGGRVDDLRGKSLLPGLADMHVHLGEPAQARWMLALLLAYGVTNVKDAGNQLDHLREIRGWVAEQPAVPHLAVSGVTLNGDRVGLQFRRAGDSTQTLLDDNLAFGVDFIKIHNFISSDALAQISAFAREHDLYLTGHVPLSMTSLAAIDGGIDILEHLRMRPAEVLDDPELVARYPIDIVVGRRTLFWAHLDPRGTAVNRTLDGWARRDVFVDPTLSLVEAGTLREQVPNLDRISPAMRASWRRNLNRYGGQEEDARTLGTRKVDGMVTFVGMAHARDIRILTGTDSPVIWVVPGESLHRELELFVEAGMTPVEAIRASTGRAAEALRAPDRGTIAPGKVADLLIVDGDISADIGAIRDLEQVMLGGTSHARPALLDRAARLAAAHQE